jgi:hypothetical protein
MIKYLFLILFFVSCGSDKNASDGVLTKSPIKSKKTPVFKNVDVDDVDTAYAYLKKNKQARHDNAKNGMARSEYFDPLKLKLMAFHDFDYEITKNDIKPYMSDLPHISAVFINEETKDFVKYSAEDEASIEKLYKEAEKGEENNKAHKELQKSYDELIKNIENKSIEVANTWSGRFFWLAGAFIVAFGISKAFFSGIASKTMISTGILCVATGSYLLLTATSIKFLGEFLEEYGSMVLLGTLIPVIIIFLITLAKKTDVIDDDNEGNDDGE